MRPSPRVLVAIFVPAMLILVGVAVVVVAGDLNVGDLTRDPVTILHGDPLTGVVSAFGVILWWFTASICLFTLVLSRSLGLGRPIRVFLLSSGLLTLLLAVDDQFLIHDELAPNFLGMREREVMAVYLVLASIYLFVNRSIIRRSEWVILATAFVFFGGSIAVDYFVQVTMTSADTIGVGLDWGLFFEDGLKLMGIAGWSAYLVRFSYFAVTQQIEHHSPEAGGA